MQDNKQQKSKLRELINTILYVLKELSSYVIMREKYRGHDKKGYKLGATWFIGMILIMIYSSSLPKDSFLETYLFSTYLIVGFVFLLVFEIINILKLRDKK